MYSRVCKLKMFNKIILFLNLFIRDKGFYIDFFDYSIKSKSTYFYVLYNKKSNEDLVYNKE